MSLPTGSHALIAGLGVNCQEKLTCQTGPQTSATEGLIMSGSPLDSDSARLAAVLELSN